MRLLVPLVLTVACLHAEQVDLSQARATDRDYQVRLENLIQQSRSEDLDTAVHAIQAIARLQDPATALVLMQLADPSKHPERVVAAAVRAITALELPQAQTILMQLASGDNPQLRTVARNLLIGLGAIEEAQLLAMAKDDAAAIRGTAMVLLGQPPISTAAMAALSEAAQRDGDKHVRRMALYALSEHATAEQAEALIVALSDGDLRVRQLAAAGLARLKYRPAIPQLLIAMESGLATNDMNEAVVAIAGQDFGYRPGDSIVQRRTAVEKAFHWYTTSKPD